MWRGMMMCCGEDFYFFPLLSMCNFNLYQITKYAGKGCAICAACACLMCLPCKHWGSHARCRPAHREQSGSVSWSRTRSIAEPGIEPVAFRLLDGRRNSCRQWFQRRSDIIKCLLSGNHMHLFPESSPCVFDVMVRKLQSMIHNCNSSCKNHQRAHFPVLLYLTLSKLLPIPFQGHSRLQLKKQWAVSFFTANLH